MSQDATAVLVYESLICSLTSETLDIQFEQELEGPCLHLPPVLSQQVLKVLNNVLLTVDSGDAAVLVLIDLSAAFDTTDHEILIARLERFIGTHGTV